MGLPLSCSSLLSFLLLSPFVTFISPFLCPFPPKFHFWPCLALLFLPHSPHPSSRSPSLVPLSPRWLARLIGVVPSCHPSGLLSLFWRLVNSLLMIYQILITARWKPHSLCWCMVMIGPLWPPRSPAKAHPFSLLFSSLCLSPLFSPLILLLHLSAFLSTHVCFPLWCNSLSFPHCIVISFLRDSCWLFYPLVTALNIKAWLDRRDVKQFFWRLGRKSKTIDSAWV